MRRPSFLGLAGALTLAAAVSSPATRDAGTGRSPRPPLLGTAVVSLRFAGARSGMVAGEGVGGQ